MRDTTVAAITALADHVEPSPPRLADEVTRSIAYARAYAYDFADPNATISNPDALVLLFDVLVGITTGRLAWDQGWWVTRRVGQPGVKVYRCLAAWVVQAAHPESQPIYGQDMESLHADRASFQRIDGVNTAMSVAFLDVLGIFSSSFASRVGVLNSLTSGHRTLGQLWEQAADLTNRVISLPPALRPLVHAIDSAEVTRG